MRCANAGDARRAGYWALFAGAAGHTYGHHSIWQMHSPKYPGVANPKRYWFEALDAPSARQMGHLRRLFESRPFATQRPAPELIAFEQDRPWEMCLGLRGDGFAMIYTPNGRSLKINLPKLAVPRATAWWFDPRQGSAVRLGEVACDRATDFDPPGDEQPGNDWVLVLDHPAKGYGPPGEPLVGTNRE